MGIPTVAARLESRRSGGDWTEPDRPPFAATRASGLAIDLLDPKIILFLAIALVITVPMILAADRGAADAAADFAGDRLGFSPASSWPSPPILCRGARVDAGTAAACNSLDRRRDFSLADSAEGQPWEGRIT